MDRLHYLEALLALVLVVSAGQLAVAESDGGVTGERENVTVVASHAHKAQAGQLLAFQHGDVIYQDASFAQYFDVDPVPGRSLSVEFIGVDAYRDGGEAFMRVGYYRANLSTGARENIWNQSFPRVSLRTVGGKVTYRHHDIDRVNDTHLVVAGMRYDRVFMVNTTANAIVWEWQANQSYSPSTGGPPSDWTHLNDVEVLPDGRIMASLRNQDSVVFLQPGGGVDDEWTLGGEDNHSIMYEQHNPDFITSGPSVIVADSQNNRIVEYDRANGTWHQTWEYSNPGMRWPRDADRLPNGHTLIADSNSHRVYEINRGGEIVWEAPAPQPYDVERLGTGDESSGPTASIAGLTSRVDAAWLFPKVRNGLLFILPVRVTQHLGQYGLASASLLGLAGVCLRRWRT